MLCRVRMLAPNCIIRGVPRKGEMKEDETNRVHIYVVNDFSGVDTSQ